MKTLLSITITALLALLGTMFWPAQPTGPGPSKPLNLNQPKVVVQYNASFNEANTYKNLESLNLPYYYVAVDKEAALKAQHKITKLPTIVYYQQGKEVKRWEGDVMMKISIPLNTLKLQIK
jgi:hypothetical protein